ncbi:hypothetical protein R1sor_027545 [Riccia sorocarpa]|uniref:Myb/SANT-like DNA-binding domain-containing protein n=1 Tax=Riccia sorocarpa TaxID=122646 RepID=A0ABD3GEH2_9MARC
MHPVPMLLEEVADYKTYANECLKPLIGHSQPIGFRFSMADNVPVYRTQKDVDGPWTPEGGLCLWTKVDGHILVPTGEPKALQLPTSHPRLGEVSPFIDNLVKCLQETYNDPTSEGYRKYTPVVEYWKTLKQQLTNIDSLPSDTLQTKFWPKTDHGTGFNPLVVSEETAVISGDLVVDDLERELNEENDVQLQHFVGDPADRPKRAFVPLEDISEGKFVILRPNDDFEAQIPRAIWLGRAMGSVVEDTNDEHHGEFLVEWWRPRHRKSMNATDKERYSAILVGQKDWEKDPGYVRPQWINASAAIYSWKYRSKEAVPIVPSEVKPSCEGCHKVALRQVLSAPPLLDFGSYGTRQLDFLGQTRPVPSTVWGNSQNFYMSRPVPVRPVSLPVVPNFGAGAAPMIHAPLFGMPNLGMMQNPSVPTGGLPPPGRDQRLPDSSPEGGPAQRRSSFGASAVRDGGIPAIGGHQPGPSAVPTAEFTPPGRDEHLPDSSPDGNPAEDDLGDGASDGDSEHEEVADDDADEEGNTGSRTYWRDFEVVFLIEAQRELQEFCNQLKGRKKKLLSKDEKWARVVETVTAKGVEKSKKQMQGKWKTLLQEHRKIRDHDKRSGEAPWASMDKATRRKKKLPLKFTDQWFALLDNFQGNRHINNPVCLESSSRVPVPEFSDPGNHSNPDLTDGVPAESRSGSLPAAAEARATSNSGVKRKKDVSRSASLLVEAIDRMSESSTTNMREVEKGRSDRETQRHQLTRELESSKQDRADQRTRILADVLSSMVSAISEMARSKRQRE